MLIAACPIDFFRLTHQTQTSMRQTKRAPQRDALNLARRGIEPLVSSVKGRRLNRSTNGPRGTVYREVFPQARYQLIQSRNEFPTNRVAAADSCESHRWLYSAAKPKRIPECNAI